MADFVKSIVNDFVAKDDRIYRFRIGHTVASSLSGFLCGFIAATIIWVIVFFYL